MDIHYLHSSFREKLIEHLFVGQLLKISWRRGDCALEVAKPEVDYQGYDLIAEMNGCVRHIQLKASHKNARASHQKVHVSLAAKPSGCVVWVYFDEETLDLGPFLFFGSAPREQLPDISTFSIAKHTKGNAQGVKLERPSIRKVNKGKFDVQESINALWIALLAPDGPTDSSRWRNLCCALATPC